MDGDVAPLREIVRLARRHEALVLVDECHATGFVGATGRGAAELEGVLHEVDIINSTLGKALGGASGGFTTGRGDVIEMLRQRSRPYLFSNAVAPALVASASAAFDILMEESGGSLRGGGGDGKSGEVGRSVRSGAGTALRRRLEENTRGFRARMTAAGFTLGGVQNADGFVHPIVPIMLGDAALANEMAERMLTQHGVYVVGFSYPVVPKGKARIRVQVSAAHKRDQLEHAAAAFEAVGKELGVI